jgi:hypothetical protein
MTRPPLAFALPALVASLLVACSDAPARSPSEHGPRAVQAASNAAALFEVGFAEGDVTPSRKLTLGGYGTYTIFGKPPRRSEGGAHDPLRVTAFAVRGGDGKGVVFVAVDAVGLSSESVKRIRTKVGAPPTTAIFVSASHSHSTPDTMGLWGALPLSGRDGRYMEELEGKAARVAMGALAALTPATLYVATGRLPNNSTGTSAQEDGFTVVEARATDGRLLGTWTQWEAHPTLLSQDNNAFSADYVGAFRRYMEAALPGAVHGYVNGAIGGVYAPEGPARRPDPFPAGHRDPDVLDEYDRMAEVGGSLADSVLASLSVSVPLATPVVEFARKDVAVDIDNWRFVAAKRAGVIETSLNADREIDWFRLGELEGATLPGEFFPSSASAIRNLLAGHGARFTTLVGMGNEWLGYLMTPEEYDDRNNGYYRDLSPSREAGRRLLDGYRALLTPP